MSNTFVLLLLIAIFVAPTWRHVEVTRLATARDKPMNRLWKGDSSACLYRDWDSG